MFLHLSVEISQAILSYSLIKKKKFFSFVIQIDYRWGLDNCNNIYYNNFYDFNHNNNYNYKWRFWRGKSHINHIYMYML